MLYMYNLSLFNLLRAMGDAFYTATTVVLLVLLSSSSQQQTMALDGEACAR
jgi:hypothetical protein